jgi:transcriptional regulator with XRE-family HTH domain
MTHALASEIGFQHGLLAEGLAVYTEDYYINGVNLHSIIKILLEENRVTPLEDLVNNFWCDILYNYDIAGSFAAFLIEEYGMEKFKELYSNPLSVDSFGEVYWRSLSVLEKKWLSRVQEAEITQTEKDIVRYRDTIKEGLAIYFEYGFGSIEYGTYPARAEEGICLFREMHDEDPEAAFSHLDQFNQGMVAWKEAMETFEEALTQKNFAEKAALFKKALSLYEIAGDNEMIGIAQKYAAAYESLAVVVDKVEQGDVTQVDKELEKAKPLLEELGHKEEIYSLEQYITDLKEQTVEEGNGGIVLVFMCVLVIKVFMRYRKKIQREETDQ